MYKIGDEVVINKMNGSYCYGTKDYEGKKGIITRLHYSMYHNKEIARVNIDGKSLLFLCEEIHKERTFKPINFAF